MLFRLSDGHIFVPLSFLFLEKYWTIERGARQQPRCERGIDIVMAVIDLTSECVRNGLCVLQRTEENLFLKVSMSFNIIDLGRTIL